MNKEASQRWPKFWSCYNEIQEDLEDINMIQMNQVFPNCSEEDEIYPLTVKEIVCIKPSDQPRDAA
jgi:hypothetical protein